MSRPGRRAAAYQGITREFAKNIWNVWAWYVDWGIATAPGPSPQMAGTPVYMAPEMLGGDDALHHVGEISAATKLNNDRRGEEIHIAAAGFLRRGLDGLVQGDAEFLLLDDAAK